MRTSRSDGAAKCYRGTQNGDSLMTRTLLLAAVALSLLAPTATADAASRQKHRQHTAAVKPANPPYVYPWRAPTVSQRRGPPWAMPNECYNDEGYGRWTPCTSRDF